MPAKPPFVVFWLHEVTRNQIPDLADAAGGPGSPGVVAFAEALVRVDGWLANVAAGLGESRTDDDVRIALSDPIGVWFEVHPDPPTAIVTRIWLTR